MPNYFIYYDKFNRSVRVHEGDCPSCQQGQGQGGGTRPEDGGWAGPYETPAAAQQAGVALVIGPVSFCRRPHCAPFWPA